MSRYSKSLSLLERARKLIPAASQTFSKSPQLFSEGVNPVFIQSGDGCHVTDVDGNRYLDFTMGLCPVILGYRHPDVDKAIRAQLEEGILFSLPHPLEVEVSEMLVSRIPSAEMVRFAKNGSDVTTAAVRVARAYTGREHILACGYHGWHDWYVGNTSRALGVPASVAALTHPFPYNDLDALDKLFAQYRDQVAAVIMEPVGVVPPQEKFLDQVKELAHRHGALLIFDEVVTGFRMAPGGAQAYFGVSPDLTCLGKSLANGMPLAALVGRRDVMALFDQVFFSLTFGGETLSLAAAQATLWAMDGAALPGPLWTQGQRLQEGFRKLVTSIGLAEHFDCIGYPPRTVVTIKGTPSIPDMALKSYVQQECAARGLLFSGAHNLSLAHTAQAIDRALAIYDEVLDAARSALRRGSLEGLLQGKVVEPVFRQA